MSQLFLTPINLNNNELLNAKMQQLGSDPTLVEGLFWWRSDTNHAYITDGSVALRMDNLTAAELLASIITVDGSGSGLDADLLDGQTGTYYLARANHTGTQLASTVSDFDTQVRLSRLDQMAVPTATVSFNSQKISNLADGTATNDAVNLGQLQAAAAGLDVKPSVRVATTAAGTLATSFENGDTVDGIVLVTGDRILIKDQAAPADNGIRVVAASGAPPRATDMDSWLEVPGAFVTVEEGTANADTVWLSTANAGGTLNTTAITFVQWEVASIVAGAGLTKTATTIDVVGTTDRILVNADSIDISPNYVGQATITTLGTITTGVWSGTVITVSKGGTGLATLTDNALYVGNGTSAMTAIAVGTTGQMLLGATGAEPAWSTATHPSTTTVNQLLYSSSTNVIAGLATANNGVLITSAGGVPSISSTLPNAVQDTITRLGTITVGVWTGTDIAVADGGTGASTAAAARTNLGATGKYSATIGDAVATSIAITQATHGLATNAQMIVALYNVSTGAQVYTDVSINNANGTVTLDFTVAPTTNQYRVVIIG